jgi:hypothetical protein
MAGTGGFLDVDVGLSDAQAARGIDLEIEALILGPRAAVEDGILLAMPYGCRSRSSTEFPVPQITLE